MYVSQFGPNDVIVDDENYGSVMLAAGTVVSGEAISYGYQPRDYEAEPYGSLPYAAPMPSDRVYSDRELVAKIEELEQTKSTISDIWFNAGLTSLHQNGTNYCWINAVVTAVEALRAVQNQPLVRLSPASAGGPITGYRNVGGWSTKGLQYVIKNGLVPVSMWPANAINRRYDTIESRQERLKYRVPEWWDMPPRNLRATLSMCVDRRPCPVGFNWWTHAVCGFDAVHFGNYEFGLAIMNSHGLGSGDRGRIILRGRKAIPDDCCCPRTTTASANKELA